MNLKYVVFHIILCLLAFPLMAQEGKLLTSNRELSNSLINSIYRDHRNVMWIGTENGLNCYDGAKYTTYQHKEGNPNSINNNHINAIYEDGKNRLFVATISGLQWYDRSNQSFRQIPMYFIGDTVRIEASISCIIEWKEHIWIGTSGHGLFKLHEQGDGLILKQDKSIIKDNFIIDFTKGEKEQLWIVAGDKKVYRISETEDISLYPMKESDISAISHCPKEGVFIGDYKGNLFLYNPIDDKFEDYLHFNSVPITNLFSAEGKFYVGTDGKGIYELNVRTKNIKLIHLNVTSIESSQAKVHCVQSDHNGNLWIGCFQKGVVILPLTPNKFQTYGANSTSKNIIGSCSVISLLCDKDGNSWIGTDGDGIYVLNSNGNLLRHYKTNNQTKLPRTIFSIFEDNKNRIWVGSYLEGLVCMDKKTGICKRIDLRTPEGSVIQSIYGIVEDNQGNLWLGSMGNGLLKYNPTNSTYKQFRMPFTGYDDRHNTINNDWINCLYTTSKGKLFIGTYDGVGCMDFATEDFSNTYGYNRLFNGEVIHTIHETPDGTIWIGSNQGLRWIKDSIDHNTLLTMEHGLPSNTIMGIQHDNNGNLWISTNAGFCRLNIQTLQVEKFYTSDGLQGNEFSGNTAIADKHGQLVFGGVNGISIFSPENITLNKKNPQIQITGFYLNNQSISDTDIMMAKEIRLHHNENSFRIEFSAMEMYNPERIQYEYALGREAWQALPPGENSISYSHLQPGEYIFKVRACDYQTYSEVRELRITILPPWWNSNWAKLIYTLIAISIIAIILQQVRQRIRMRQEMMQHKHAEELNEAKLQFFINISHEIRTPMTLILNPLQKIMQNDEDESMRHRAYNTIHRNAQRILQLVNQLMDIRKIDKGQMKLTFHEVDMNIFLQELYETFLPASNRKNISFQFIHPTDPVHAWIDPVNFDKVIMNLLSNALKFTPEGGNILLSLTNDKNQIRIKVTDTGIGIKTEDRQHIFDRFYQGNNTMHGSYVGTGVGLHLTRSLVELHQGTIQVSDNTEAANGTCFTITLPVGDEHISHECKSTEEPLHPTNSLPVVMPLEEEKQVKRTKTTFHIAVIDDEEEIRRYIMEELADEYHVKGYSDAKDALPEILQKAPDLIISDVMMPEMDGFTFCRKIKQNPHTNTVPVILLTAKGGEESNLEGLETGADAYITKPFNIDILRQTIGNMITIRQKMKNVVTGQHTQEEKMEKIEHKSADEKLMERIMRIINENLSDSEFNLEKLSSEVGISRVHLNRKLKELTNQTSRDFLRNVRLRAAAQMLSEKHQTISEVAELTGFSSHASFTTAFKELYGVSPSEYMNDKADSK